MNADVIGAGVAAPVAVVASERPVGAAFQGAAKDVASVADGSACDLVHTDHYGWDGGNVGMTYGNVRYRRGL